MGIQFFGEFLIDRWVITRGQLIEALELQEYRNTRLGAVAREKGYLDPQQVEAINARQQVSDHKFGELAEELGFMTGEQVQEVLTYHKNNHLHLGEALLELGHVTEDILDRELSIFEEEQAAYASDTVAMPNNIPGGAIVESVVDLTRKMFQRVAGLRIKVDQGVVAEQTFVKDWGDFDVTVVIPLLASPGVRFVLSVTHDIAVLIASALLKEDASSESRELIQDSLGEFGNLVCGNASARLAQSGTTVEIQPPQLVSQVPSVLPEESMVVFPIRVAGTGMVDVRFLVPRVPTAHRS